MKKIFATIFIILSFAYANDNIFNQIDNLGSIIGKDNADIYKAIAYEKGDSSNGIKKDPQKALQYYYSAFKNNNPIGAYKVGYFYWEIESMKDQKKMQEIISTAKKITDGKTNPSYFFSKGSQMGKKEMRYKEIADLLGVVNGVYLFLHNEEERSIQALTERKSIQERPEAQLYLAFNYFKMNNLQMADFFLSKACNNPKKGRELTEFCNNPKKVKAINK